MRGLLVGLALVPAALAGCAMTAGDAADATKLSQADLGSWAGCMRDRGVPVEDPALGAEDSVGFQIPDGVDPDAYLRASAACDDAFGETGAGSGAADAVDPAVLERMRAIASCARENGVPDYPDPDGSGVIDRTGLAEAEDVVAEVERTCGTRYDEASR